MRKHSKFITILLSAVLAVCLVQTVFVQAFASEMDDDDYGWGSAATADEADDDLLPVSMKVVKAPKTVIVSKGEISDKDFWKNVVVHIAYSNGEEYDVNCDGIDSENGIAAPIAKIGDADGRITVSESNIIDFKSPTLDLTLSCSYSDSYSYYREVTAKFSVEKPYTIVRGEVTKLPDRVFTEPIFTGNIDDIKDSKKWEKWAMSLDSNKSVANHIDGMEITFYYANGEKGGTVTFDSSMMYACTPWFAMYSAENVDKYGNSLPVSVRDEGNYKFSVYIMDVIGDNNGVVYTAKSVENPNPAVKPTSTEDTPVKPSDNNSSSTSDTATKDNADNNTNGSGTANNGAVATGDFAAPAIILVVMISAVAVMFVLKRKQTL